MSYVICTSDLHRISCFCVTDWRCRSFCVRIIFLFVNHIWSQMTIHTGAVESIPFNNSAAANNLCSATNYLAIFTRLFYKKYHLRIKKTIKLVFFRVWYFICKTHWRTSIFICIHLGHCNELLVPSYNNIKSLSKAK